MNRRWLAALVFTAGFLALAPAAWSGGQTPKPDSNVLERFPVAKDGEIIRLPVALKDAKRLCVLDTGATISVYDSSLPLGEALGTINGQGPAGSREVKLHAPPAAKLGGLAVHGRDFPVAAIDMAKLRQVDGEPIYGVIGMDFLLVNVVQIDFDAGELRVLKAADARCGDKFGVVIRKNVPRIKLKLADVGELEFLVDTGANCTGDIEEELFDKLVKQKHLKVVGSTLSESITGTSTSRVARARGLELGDFKVAEPIFGESRTNLLGLGFWSRFVVTFDFANDTIYLKKGQGFNRPDWHNLSGMNLLRVDGKVVVFAVDKEGVAAARGIKAGDEIVTVDGKAAARLSMFEIRRGLGQPGQTVRLEVRRGEENRMVELALAKG